MNQLPEGTVLDEVGSPGGVLELVTLQAKGTVWIGVKLKGLPLESAIGLHTGSEKNQYFEATAEMHGTWGVAFGAVSPEIERVEVWNERGKSFPARIVPLPVHFGEQYRAAWGVATECRRSCELTGYDDRGRFIDGEMIRPRRRDLTADETLELIRTHCERSLRDLTWALKRMPSIPEQAGHVKHVENELHERALLLAYVEGADDERTAGSSVGAILRRYAAAVEAEGWEPPFAHEESSNR